MKVLLDLFMLIVFVLKGLSIVYLFAVITSVLDSMIKRKVARRTTMPDAPDEICS